MKKRWIKHLLFWLAYHAFEVYTDFLWMVNQYKLPLWDAFEISFTSETTILVLIKLPMVYAMFYFLSRYMVEKPSKWKLVLSLGAVLILFTVLAQLIVVYVLLPTVYHNLDIVETFAFQGIVNSFMDKVFIACLAISLKQLSNSQKLREREQFLVKEKLQTELGFLKSQINPHFLFNTLNNIYALARKKSDKTAEVVLGLSKLLRFVMYETKDEFIPICKELDFLKEYIELHKIRHGERLHMEVNYEVDDIDTSILPLVLIPFVENAFKYGPGQSTDEAYICIHLKLKQKMLDFKVTNSFEPDKSDQDQEGIGLKNLHRRLELIYGEFKLHTRVENNTFKAELLLDLNQIL